MIPTSGSETRGFELAKFSSMGKAEEQHPQVGAFWDSGVTGYGRYIGERTK